MVENIILGLILAAAVIYIVFYIRRSVKKSECSSGCDSCPSSETTVSETECGSCSMREDCERGGNP